MHWRKCEDDWIGVIFLSQADWQTISPDSIRELARLEDRFEFETEIKRTKKSDGYQLRTESITNQHRVMRLIEKLIERRREPHG